jgi:hypothetical protein
VESGEGEQVSAAEWRRKELGSRRARGERGEGESRLKDALARGASYMTALALRRSRSRVFYSVVIVIAAALIT